MTTDITTYIDELDRLYQIGDATEHSYRPALQRLLETIVTTENIHDTQVTNEPRRIACGAPDYIVTRNGIPVGYIEAKDVGANLNDKAHKAQFDRYKAALDNLIITDYLDFHFYRGGELTESIRVGQAGDGKIVPIKENADRFNILITSFCRATAQSIKSADDLAKIMAEKARLMAGVIEKAVSDPDSNSLLAGQMAMFKKFLVPDITPKTFADAHSQTIAYGMFAARLHCAPPDKFARTNIAHLIPKTNPFLRRMFHSIAGIDLDDSICWIVDDLVEAFSVTDINAVMADIGNDTRGDPMIHFYENFLTAYDPALRKSRGVWYTPHSVVNFIVRAVDEILQKEFDLKGGLADASKTKIKVKQKESNASGQFEDEEIEVHNVQILDPAIGTGTFLAETVSLIYGKYGKRIGAWQNYVEEHLIPRLNGFELLVAPYAMAHIKLDWMLSQTGYVAKNNKRLRVYLTNSLEEQCTVQTMLFEQFLLQEAEEANAIKRDAPVMVVMGNPPYSGVSQNNNPWINGLMDDYKKEPDTELPLRERNPKWINDDYCKFIRLGQEFISKNNEGILAYINNHSFIDNPTFRGMRWNLMKTFDKIYIIDLHGNSKKKEACPDGGKDENVFDIQQGVSINIFVKTKRKAKASNKGARSLAKVYHFDLYGKREEKYDYLRKHKLSAIPFVRVEPTAPFYFFVPTLENNRDEYENGFAINELFRTNVTGVVTARDSLVIDMDEKSLLSRMKYFGDTKISDDEIRRNLFSDKSNVKYFAGDSGSWELSEARKKIKRNNHRDFIVNVDYRPFDIRKIYYTPDMIDRGRESVMRHFLVGENVGLMVCRQQKTNGFYHCLIHRNIVESSFVSNNTSEIGYSFPLYLYPQNKQLLTDKNRGPNLNETIVNDISKQTGLRFTEEKVTTKNTFAPIDILDYIYAVLHSPSYREKYKEFLRIDFPRIPYPQDADQFRNLAKLGGKLRGLHLLDGIELKDGLADFPIAGGCEVDRPRYEIIDNGNIDNKNVGSLINRPSVGRVYINAAQYFDNIPPEAWDFHIGGYQPAQKWLKDRKGRKLDFDDVDHYRKIIFVLRETVKIMTEIG